MRILGFGLATAVAVAAAGCGATTRSGSTAVAAPVTVSGAAVTFMTRGDGKDEDSAIAVQLLDDAVLSAEGTVVDVEFDDQSVSAPLNLTTMRAIPGNDLDDAQVRLRLTPDGRDTWAFDMRLAVRLSDGTERQYFWSGLRLDESSPERTLTLRSGRLP
jgi:hypothetical protein